MAQGGRKRRVTDDELLTVFRDADDPVLTSSEVAEHVPIKRSGVGQRLESLRENGKVRKKKVGGRATVWWVPDTGKMEHISRRNEGDYYTENPNWDEDLPDLGEGT